MPTFAPMNISTVHSAWLAPVCLLVGIALAWLLYRRSAAKDGFTPRLALLLATLRAFTVALVAFFLLEPMVRMLLREVRKPLVVLLHDGSSSLVLAGDSTALRSTYADALKRLEDELAKEHEVRSFTYGAQVRDGLGFDQNDDLTDMGQALREVYDRFSGPDLGAVIIDGDGIQNRGRDPRTDADRLGVPVHTIALGDTTVRPDLVLKGVEHNRIAFLGNEFPLRVRVDAKHLKGSRCKVLVRWGGAEVAAEEGAVSGDPWTKEFTFSIKAAKSGMQRFTVIVVPVSGEHSDANNTQDLFIDVLDDRQKVLLLGAAPHPDLGAIRSALEGAEGYEAELAYAPDFSGAVESYDLIVLHGLPNVRTSVQPLLQRAASKGIPVLVVLTTTTDINSYNTLGAGVRISGLRSAITDAQAVADSKFTYFTLEQDMVKALERYPPLQVPFGQYELERAAVPLATQRVGVVKTTYPLIAVSQQNERRMATICGEGLWRWRITDQQLFGSHERFDRLVHKLVQFLALKADKKRFRVEHVPVFTANEPVIMNAELYNAAYEPVTESEISIVLKHEDGKEFPYAFRASGNAYRLDAGRLPAGTYSWQARAELKGERFSAQGEFTVRPTYLERMNTVADHGLMADLAARTGGRMFAPERTDSIVAAIRSEKTITARSYAHTRFSDLIGLRWIFFVVLTLLAAEWALRRRNGSY